MEHVAIEVLWQGSVRAGQVQGILAKFVLLTKCPLEVGSPFHPDKSRRWLVDLSLVYFASLGSKCSEFLPCRFVRELDAVDQSCCEKMITRRRNLSHTLATTI